MIKKFNQFVTENTGEVSEIAPAVAAAAAPVVADMAAKKLAEGKNLDPSEMGALVTETCQAYEADENPEHTFEGYVMEMLKENAAIAQAAAPIVADMVAKKMEKK